MKLSFLAVALPHAAAFAGPSLLRPRLPALRTSTPALVLEHAAPVLDSVTTSLAFAFSGRWFASVLSGSFSSVSTHLVLMIQLVACEYRAARVRRWRCALPVQHSQQLCGSTS